jgi:hypothetical protein
VSEISEELDRALESREVWARKYFNAAEEITALRSQLEQAQARLDATLVAALRYESLHDRDPNRGELWGELKMALMVSAALPAAGGEKK